MLLMLVFILLSEFFVFSTTEEATEALPSVALIAMLLFTSVAAGILMYCYVERIQMYEIMAGCTPHQIILGRTAICLPITIVYLGGFTVMCLCFDNSPDMVRRLLLFCMIGIRSVLSVVFLSPLTKGSAFAPIASFMLLMIFNQSDIHVVAQSPIALLCCGQCVSLGIEITEGFVIKVVATAIVACVIYYLIGYYTLKKKFDLEPHKLT